MGYTPHQRRMQQLALRLSSRDHPRVQRALLAAMAVEANFRNVNYGDRDSEGVLQQRPSQGWGSASETAAQDINQFLERARRTNRGFHGTAGQLAQAIQRSAYPGRYDDRMSEVNSILRGQMGRAGSMPKVPVGSLGMESGALSGESFKSAMSSYLLNSALQTAAGMGPNPADLISLSVMKRSMDSAPSSVGFDDGHDHGGGASLPSGRGGITYSGQKFTHDTDGLPGFPAIDQFAKPGTPYLAPVSGRIVRHSGRGGTKGSVYGHSLYLEGDDGKTYFITHLNKKRAFGRVRKGQPIGTISRWDSGAPHAHVGVRG